jgi:hypothetical protein
MKTPLISLIFLISLFGCDNNIYYRAEFSLVNNCDLPIDVYTSALVRYETGYEEISLLDIVSPGDTLSMRKFDVTDSVRIKDVFTKILIINSSKQITIDPMEKNKWVYRKTDNGKVKYTLLVDDSLFK